MIKIYTEAGSLIKTYKDYKIIMAENGVEVEGHTFPNVIAAEKWINGNPIKNTVTPSSTDEFTV